MTTEQESEHHAPTHNGLGPAEHGHHTPTPSGCEPTKHPDPPDHHHPDRFTGVPVSPGDFDGKYRVFSVQPHDFDDHSDAIPWAQVTDLLSVDVLAEDPQDPEAACIVPRAALFTNLAKDRAHVKVPMSYVAPFAELSSFVSSRPNGCSEDYVMSIKYVGELTANMLKDAKVNTPQRQKNAAFDKLIKDLEQLLSKGRQGRVLTINFVNRFKHPGGVVHVHEEK